MPKSECVSEFVYGLFRRALKEKFSATRTAIECLVKSTEGNQRNPAGEVSLAENEVEVAGPGVKIDVEHPEHPVFTCYPVSHPFEYEVRVVLLSRGVVGSWRDSDRGTGHAFFNKR